MVDLLITLKQSEINRINTIIIEEHRRILYSNEVRQVFTNIKNAISNINTIFTLEDEGGDPIPKAIKELIEEFQYDCVIAIETILDKTNKSIFEDELISNVMKKILNKTPNHQGITSNDRGIIITTKS